MKNEGNYGAIAGQRTLMRKMRRFTVAKSGESGIMEQTGEFGKKLKISDSQFGKKAGKHAKDFGLEPSSSESRQIVKDRINEIFRNPTEIREGIFRGQGDVLPNGVNASGNVRFLNRSKA